MPERTLNYAVMSPGPDVGPEYETALRTAFEFLRRHGRYTSRSLGRILRVADRYESRRMYGERPSHDGPVVITAMSEARYDEDTEVKYGGAMGIAVSWPEDGRVMLAVHHESRRQGVGRELVHSAVHYSGNAAPVTWLAADNFDGQRFLLAQSWRVVALNSAGAVCYAPSQADSEEGYNEDDAMLAPLPGGSRHPGDWVARRPDEPLLSRRAAGRALAAAAAGRGEPGPGPASRAWEDWMEPDHSDDF